MVRKFAIRLSTKEHNVQEFDRARRKRCLERRAGAGRHAVYAALGRGCRGRVFESRGPRQSYGEGHGGYLSLRGSVRSCPARLEWRCVVSRSSRNFVGEQLELRFAWPRYRLAKDVFIMRLGGTVW